VKKSHVGNVNVDVTENSVQTDEKVTEVIWIEVNDKLFEKVEIHGTIVVSTPSAVFEISLI
jgi:hypothetical protein